MKGTQAMATVVAAYLRNLTIYNRDPKDFWDQVRFKIKHNPLPLFRFFDAGDIPSYEFFCGMVELAKDFPDIKFMSFTKKYDIVNEWLKANGNLPDNLNIIFSAWHIGWEVNNPYGMPVAYVDFTDKTLNPEFPKGITGCPNQKDKTITCSVCQKCWSKKVKAVKFVQTMELNKGVKIACLEEIAFNQGFISKSDLMAKIEKFGYKNEYYNYVRTILNQSGETILA